MSVHPYTRLFSGKTTAPTVDDDTSLGYEVGDVWVDETNDKIYEATDVTDGAAVWIETSGGSADLGAAIHAAPSSAITDDDEVGFWEDVANALRKITWANIKATLKTYFDTLYAAIGHTHTIPTQEDIEDYVGAMVSGNTETGIEVTYDDAGGKLNFDAQTAGDARYAPIDAWIAGAGTWSYSSADSPTFVISINADVTAILGVGDRIKLTQTTVKYFIVTAVGSYSGGATLVTVYGGTDYTLANASITSPYYSHAKKPFGFPTSPDKWTGSFTDSSARSQTSPTQFTWYNVGSLSISLPIGSWKVNLKASVQGQITTAGAADCYITLSSANNSESNAKMTAGFYFGATGPTATVIIFSVSPSDLITAASKTTMYMNIRTINAGMNNIQERNDIAAMLVTWESAYL